MKSDEIIFARAVIAVKSFLIPQKSKGADVPTNHPRNRVIDINLLNPPQIAHHNSICNQQRQKTQEAHRVDNADERSGNMSRENYVFWHL